MDTGAEVSLIKRKIYDSLKYKPELQRKRLNLMGVDGSPLDIDGVARISFIIGGNSVVQDFYVTRSMSKNVILGRDWLLSNGVRLYFDLKSLRIKNAYVPLEEDVHISSVEKGSNCRLASLKINDTIVPLDISSLLRTTGKVKIKPGDVEPLTDEQLKGDDMMSNLDQDMSILQVKVKRPKSRSIKAKGLLKALYQFL